MPAVLATAWLATLGGWGAPAMAAERDARNRIVAIVNSEVITAADIAQAMAPLYGQYQAVYAPDELPAKIEEARQQIVTLLVEERLMLQEATTPRQVEVAKGKWATPVPITVSSEEIADAMTQIRQQFPTEEEFHAILQAHGMTLPDLEHKYRDQITIQKLIGREVRSRIVVAPSEITAYYLAHLEEYKAPEAIRLSNLLIRVGGRVTAAQAESRVRALRQQLAAGQATFSDLAQRVSEGPNAAQGGGLDWIERGRFMPELEESVFALEPGELSPVLKSSLGYHLFRVEERRPSRTQPIVEVSGEIRKRLSEERYRQRYAEWIGGLKDRAYITMKADAA